MAIAGTVEDIRWVSCRGGPSGSGSEDEAGLTFKEAALTGWAADGGMLMPSSIPTTNAAEMEAWRALSYPDLCVAVLSKWIPTSAITLVELRDLVASACAQFGLQPEVLNLHSLPGTTSSALFKETSAELFVLELFHGSTLAFKDLGMCLLVEVLNHFLTQDQQRLCLVVGTSGDTGPSALAAAANKPDTLDCIVLYPLGRVSPVQEGQMLQLGATFPNAHVIGVEGTSDDLDGPCEAVLKDLSFKSKHCLGTVNSVNIVRMLAQTVHYFWAYFRLAHNDAADSPAKVSFCVPSGAAGHVTAGLIAQAMGLPVFKLAMATNANAGLHAMVSKGILQRASQVEKTASNAMDIQVPYNYERLLYLVSKGDFQAVREWVAAVSRGETVNLPQHIAVDGFQAWGLVSAAVGAGCTPDSVNEEIFATIRSTWEADRYLLDPHTAVGVAAAKQLFTNRPKAASGDNSPESTAPGAAEVGIGVATKQSLHRVCVMGCAAPAKFPESIATALGLASVEEAVALLRGDGAGSCRHRHANAALNLLTTKEACNGSIDKDIQVSAVGETARFSREGSSQWEAKLRSIIEEITARYDRNN